MTKKSPKILAGIVSFNPEISKLSKNICAIKNQVAEVLIVDNASENIREIEKLAGKIGGVKIQKFAKNRGVAAALNTIGDAAVAGKFDYFLTLDQDNVMFARAIKNYEKYLDLPKLGIMNCWFRDKARDRTMPENAKLIETPILISGGSLMPTEIFAKNLRYDEKMFIDDVDFDMTLNLMRHGYKTYKIPFLGGDHTLGNFTTIEKRGKTIYNSNYSPTRRYFMARNNVILERKYGRKILDQYGFGFHESSSMKKFSRILRYENQKFAKIRAIFRGKLTDILLKSFAKQTKKTGHFADSRRQIHRQNARNSRKNPNVKVVIKRNRKNVGWRRNFQKLIKDSRKIRAEYVFFSDQDDEWLPEKIAEQTKILDENPKINLLAHYYEVEILAKTADVPLFPGTVIDGVAHGFDTRLDGKVREASLIFDQRKDKKSGAYVVNGMAMCVRKTFVDTLAKVWKNSRNPINYDRVIQNLAGLTGSYFVHDKVLARWNRRTNNASNSRKKKELNRLIGMEDLYKTTLRYIKFLKKGAKK